jgi:DNA polymerase-3 subunit gamma/tau
LSQAVFARDISGVLKNIDEAWRHGYEMKRFYSDLVTHFHHLNLAGMGTDALEVLDLSPHEARRMQAQVKNVDPVTLMHVFDLLFQAESSVKLSSQPRFALEMVFLKMFQTPPGLSIDALIDKLDELRDGIVVHNVPAQPQRNEASQVSGDPEAGPRKTEATETPPSKADDLYAQPAKPAETPMDSESLWEKVIQRVTKEKPSLASILKNCSFTGESEEQFDVEVRGNDFSFKSVTRQHQMLEKLCCEITGRSVKLNLVANIEDSAAKRQKKKKATQLEQNALGHPMVMEVIKLFDGKVVDVTIL